MEVCRRTLLIADDDAGLRGTLQDVFESHFEVLTACDGREALDVLATREADLALFDVQMGDVSGLDVVQTLRHDRRMLPCTLMTARPTDDVLRKAATFGIDPVLTKPFGIAAVISAVGRVLMASYGPEAVPAGMLPAKN